MKIHDKNWPGDDGWKVDFEIPDRNFSKHVPYWCDKCIVYERFLQEITEDNGEHIAILTDFAVNRKEFNVKFENEKVTFEEVKQDTEEMEM